MENYKYIMGIETSCDETSISIISGKNILSNVIFSQIDIHKEFGGVFPEIAAREHVRNILPTYIQSLDKANISIKDIDLIAVTNKPGLKSSLLTGINFANAISLFYNIKVKYVDHIMGHIYSTEFVEDFTFPLIGVVCSGGHTQLIKMEEHGSYEVISSTRDDAIGEIFDKVAKVIGLEYPGGPIIDKLANLGEPNIKMPSIRVEGLDMSFSGLKTYCRQYFQNNPETNINDFCASLQTCAVDHLMSKIKKAKDIYQPKRIVVCGGVSANSYLRKQVEKYFNNHIIAPIELTGDNGAMIANAARYLKDV